MAGPKYSKKQKEQFFDLIDRGGTVRGGASTPNYPCQIF